MAITLLDRHDSHPMQIHLTTPGATKHWAALRCRQCNTHIQWLSQTNTQQLIDMGVGVSTKMYVPKKKLKENHGV
jgi:hypothetical protein